jgi:hypothetical protein
MRSSNLPRSIRYAITAGRYEHMSDLEMGKARYYARSRDAARMRGDNAATYAERTECAVRRARVYNQERITHLIKARDALAGELEMARCEARHAALLQARNVTRDATRELSKTERSDMDALVIALDRLRASIIKQAG